MTLHLTLTPETESRLREQAAAAGTDLATFVMQAVEARVQGANDHKREGRLMAPQAWSGEWHFWANGHRRLIGPADDSRESIYAGRGG